MSKRLILILALAFVAAMSLSAYAEVQNVKVSGDITLMGVSRDNMDLAKTRPTSPTANNTFIKDDKYSNAIAITRVRVDADLTDNVSTTVRLINERVWGSEDDTNGDTGVDIDLAYATLKEFLYSPLTVTVGRQELHFGTDFIMGDSGTKYSTNSNLPYYEKDLSSRRAFDAVRATLNYDPLVVDVIWAKVTEGSTTVNDDTTLSGINANYALNKQTTLEGYFFSKIKDSGSSKVWTATNFTNIAKGEKVFTVGGRVANSSVKNLALGLESAFQFGTYNPQLHALSIDSFTDAGPKAVNRRAWALEATGNYDLKDISMISKYAPSVGALYAYFSGDNGQQKTDDKVWHGWDPMYSNKVYGHLAHALFDYKNMSIVGLNGKMKIVDDVTLKLDYLWFWLNKAYRGGSEDGTGNGDLVYLKDSLSASAYRMTHNRNLGQELDATLTYDYTEDVQFSLLGGLFFPGSAFTAGTGGTSDSSDVGNRSVASEVIGSMKVTF